MSTPGKDQITDLLVAWNRGDERALEVLMPRVYEQLRAIAGQNLRRERPDHTLQSAALVHEAYLRLIELDRVEWRDRVHFYALCAGMMRRILVDHARHQGRVKRGGEFEKVSLDDQVEVMLPAGDELIALDDALRDLAENDELEARIIELRYFGGLNREEIAEVLSISSATVTRRWRLARAWLYRYLVKGEQIEL